jgi:poly-gamma-glutamate capsule biosynthesis protein CapA/YwtB (metallophosphatase superfamily)
MQKYGKLIWIVFISVVSICLLCALILAFKNQESELNEVSTPTPSTSPLPSLPLSPTLTRIFFAGDIMLSRHVNTKMVEASNFSLPFENTKDIINGADISFANLESPFSDKETLAHRDLVFKASPDAIQGLLAAGFDILSVANNHALDQGTYGINYTYNWLTEHGILPSGIGPKTVDITDAIIEKNGISYAFLSYSYSAANLGGDSSPLVGNFNNPEQMKQDILEIKGHYADVVIVSMHAGAEYTREPNNKQVEFAHKAIDAGADIVIGHHPHWVQTVEKYNGKWILYSLGNFVFDQMWSRDTREGLTAMATYDGSSLIKLEINPVIIDNYCCPRWATEEEKTAILNKINLTSSILMNNN